MFFSGINGKKIIFLVILCLNLGGFGVDAGAVNKKNINRNRKMFLNVSRNVNKDNLYLSKADEDIFRQIKRKINNKEWFEAYKLEKRIVDDGYREAINTYISLQKFRQVEIATAQEVKGLIDFNTENYFLNDFKNFNNTIEYHYLRNVVKYDDVKDYFKKFSSKNIDVIIKLLKDEKNAIVDANKNNDVKLKKEVATMDAKIRSIWVKGDFNDKEQKLFLDTFSGIINDSDKVKRAEFLVFKKNFKMLKQLFPSIKSEDYRSLFTAIIGIEEKKPSSIGKLLRSVPGGLRNNEALLFTQLKYYRAKDNDDRAINILLNLKGKREYSRYWWVYRNIYARDLMREKKYKDAYTLVSEYESNDDNYSESQWLSGWLSYRYLNNIEMAIKHFNNYHKVVSYPASVAKASYWLGRVYYDKGSEREAVYWFNISSKYSLTYYGQLAHYAKYNILTNKGEEYKEMELPSVPEITDEDVENINKNRIVKLAFLYYNYEGRRGEANEIFKELILKLLKKKGEIAELIRCVEALDDERMIIPLSKIASYRMVFFTDNLFPLLRMVKKNDENIAVIHAIIKQESGFIIQAESGAGAIGFMQIMPGTAKVLCKQLHITYNKYKLKNDPQYNIKLGSYYINQLIRQFNGSKILAIASYNAGPGATKRWINDFGDPRKRENVEDVIDWIESITYKETRNYVQRILENLLVYEYKLGIGE